MPEGKKQDMLIKETEMKGLNRQNECISAREWSQNANKEFEIPESNNWIDITNAIITHHFVSNKIATHGTSSCYL